MSEEDNRTGVSWNIAAAQSKHIFNLISRSTTAYLDGNLGKWFQILTALREMFNYTLNKDERKSLSKLEKKAKYYKRYWVKYSKLISEGQEPPKEIIIKNNKFSYIVRKYSRKIMDLLYELGYFPDKEDRTNLGF